MSSSLILYVLSTSAMRCIKEKSNLYSVARIVYCDHGVIYVPLNNLIMVKN